MTAGPAAPSPGGQRRAWPVIHTVLRAVFGAALVVLLVLIGFRVAGQQATLAASTPSATAESTPTPSTTPTPTASATPTPTPTLPGGTGGSGGSGGTGGSGGGGGTSAPVITSFSGPSTVDCPVPAEAPVPGVPKPGPPTVSFSWTSTGGDEAWFGIATTDAKAAPWSMVGLNDSISVDYQCGNASEIYTVTVSGAGGDTSKTITVTNVGHVG
jgi:hypothetical protein